MDESKQIVFYDIASGPPRRTFAVNPWKTRYALNFKKVPYKTNWVELPDIKSTRQKLGAAPNRTLPDGSDFYTLPVIQDFSHGDTVVGDTFDIALYLDQTYPADTHGTSSSSSSSSSLLIPKGSEGVTAAFNAQVDALFTARVMLFSHGMPLNPANADEVKRSWSARFNDTPWEQLGVQGQARTEMWADLKLALAELQRTAYRCSSSGRGPFLNGDATEEPVYADFIVGAWVSMLKATVSQDEWRDFCGWHGGLWGRLHAALEKYAEIK